MLRSFFFFNDTATTEIYTLSLHDALPICSLIFDGEAGGRPRAWAAGQSGRCRRRRRSEEHTSELSHSQISYAVFCLKKKKTTPIPTIIQTLLVARKDICTSSHTSRQSSRV